jgi:hypothetical protein
MVDLDHKQFTVSRRKAQSGDTKMFSKTKITLSAAIVLSTALTASAATKHHRVTHVHPAIYNMVPDTIGGGCPPSGGPSCSSSCSGAGPCAPTDGW